MFDDPLPVKRCVCFDTTFAQMKASGVASVEEATERFGCGSNCGTCIPYIQAMLQTGEIAVPVIERSERLD